MREGYTSQAKKALAYAVKTAEKCGHNYVLSLIHISEPTRPY